jgi:hypothetical protein
MTFKKKFATSAECFPSKIKGKHFFENQLKFFLIRKCFSLTNISNDKQT